MPPQVMIRFRTGPKGMVLIAAALTIVLLVGMLGLAVDLARMYTARNELQAFVDAASIAGATQLDGTNDGIQHARILAQSYPVKWNFQSSTPQNVEVTFSDSANGAYVTNPASSRGIIFVRVTADAPVRLYFLPGFSTLAPGPAPAVWFSFIGQTQTISARATSGQLLVTSFTNGLLPYAPDAIDILDANNFGYTPGQMYTLRWPPMGQRDNAKQWCDGDQAANFVTPGTSNDRGFIDIAGTGSSDIRDAIINNAQTRPLAIGDTVVDRGGNRGTESEALRDRWAQDNDTTSWTYSSYMAKINDPNFFGPQGNGRRVVIVPVRNGNTDVVLGFAGFFLHQDVCMEGGDSRTGSGNGNGQANSSTCCGEYIGPALVPNRKGGSNNVGAYRVKLFK